MQRNRKAYSLPSPVQFDGVVAKASGASISFSEVIKKYDVTAEQLKNDMKQLRWRQIGKEYFFELKEIRRMYVVDGDKLSALAKLQAASEICEG